MKKIVLIGDSDRFGYDVMVRQAYDGIAKVYFPRDNSCFAAYALRWLHEWKNQMGCGDDVDLVHWNVGLWDCLILYRDGPLTPIDVYEQYMERLCRRIALLFPQAKCIFATSAPMVEELFEDPDFAVRYNKDIEAYNEAAIRAVTKYGHEINDLYGFLADKPKEWHSDMAHFYTRAGAEGLTHKVTDAIDAALDIRAGKVDFDAWFDETDCYEGGAWLRRRWKATEAFDMQQKLGM